MAQKIFISHSFLDREFALWLASKLKDKHLQVWLDEKELNVGDFIKDKIKEGIESSTVFIILLSKNSLSSEWVKWELNSALLYNATKNNIKILPIKLDDSTLPPDLLSYYYADATKDKEVAYEAVLDVITNNNYNKYFKGWSELSAKRFEELVYDLLSAENRTVIKMPAMRDAGVDFEIEETNSFGQTEKMPVIVKFYSNKVGINQLTQIYANVLFTNSTKALLVTSSELTMHSKTFLSGLKTNIIVWESQDIIQKLKKHPELIVKYFPNSQPIEEPVQLIDDELKKSQSLIKELETCPKGITGWRQYEDICVQIINHLFVPPLNEPKIQSRRENNIDIRDAIYPNRTFEDNWRFIRESYEAKYIVFEFKNYDENGLEIDKSVVLQINDYLKKQTIGKFGVICSPKAPVISAIEKRKDVFIETGKLILFVNNDHLKEMILRKYKKLNPFDILNDLIDDFNLKF